MSDRPGEPVRPLLLVGTRPEAIKLAPVIEACRRPGVDPTVCLTGQHRELLEPVVEYFGIEAHHRLDLMRPDQSPSDLTARVLTALTPLLHQLRPDCVVGQGDTTTVMAGAVAAYHARLPFVHVEAGLRTYDLEQPWPEEFNRRVVSLATALHCAPTRTAAEQLIAERVPAARVHVTGNPVIDALLATRERERGRDRWARKHAALGARRLVLITAHRREHFGSTLEGICRAFRELSERAPDVEFLYPVHLNPNVREPVGRLLGGLPNFHRVEPVPYPECVWLMDRATVILTDSGGIQEEAPSLRKPVVLLRNTTERPEALEAGAVAMAGTDPAKIVEITLRLLDDPEEYARHQIDENPYGDGRAAGRIADLIEKRAW